MPLGSGARDSSRDDESRTALGQAQTKEMHMSDVAAGVTAPPTGPSTKAAPSAPASPQRGSLADAIQPVEHETRDRIITGALTVIPFLLLGIVAWQLAGSW